MKCFFCGEESGDEYITTSRIHHEAELNDLGEIIKRYDDITIDMNFCSRICAIAENITFNTINDLQENKTVNVAAGEYDKESTTILSSAFDRMQETVIIECECSEDEFDEAFEKAVCRALELTKEKEDFDKYL